MWEIQTDLALEQQEQFQRDETEVEGVILEKKHNRKNGILTTKIEITNENGSRAMKKPMGRYLTLEFAAETPAEEVCASLEECLGSMIRKKPHTVLFAGLGNADMTADALGPETAEKILATRALSKEKKGFAVVAPGVMAQTGMESAEVISGICAMIRPELVIAADALAAKSSFRLGKTIQLTDTGISPGSGIGNTRQRINEDTIGVPVIAIGVPTVVSAAAIVCDALEMLEEVFFGKEMLGSLEHLTRQERNELMLELMLPRIGSLYVAPKNMDELILNMSKILSVTLNRMFA